MIFFGERTNLFQRLFSNEEIKKKKAAFFAQIFCPKVAQKFSLDLS
jgi:hypothetical protein